MKKYLIILIAIIGCFLSIYYINKKPTISVVMSTYNRASVLPVAIESILNQTVKDFDFIIINDGSPDNTAEILNKYAKKDKRIKIITNEKNLGLIASLNKGLDLAKGKYIARMDDDDKSVPTRFQLQIDYMEKNKDVTVTGTTQFAHDESFFVPVQKVNVEASSEELAVTSHYNVPILHPSAMIRGDFIKKHNIRYEKGYDSAEDTPFWLSIIKKGGKIIRLTPPLVINAKNSPKKENYYTEQKTSYKKFLNDYLKNILQGYKFSDNSWLTRDEVCFILQQLKNNPKPYFLLSEIEKIQKQKNCSDRYEIFYFLGRNFLVKTKDTPYVFNSTAFDLEKIEDDKITLVSEPVHLTFQKENGIYYLLNKYNIIKIQHPDWDDYAVISDKEILFFSKDREAQLISFDNDMLKINFEKWGEESFKNDGSGTYHFQQNHQ